MNVGVVDSDIFGGLKPIKHTRSSVVTAFSSPVFNVETTVFMTSELLLGGKVLLCGIEE